MRASLALLVVLAAFAVSVGQVPHTLSYQGVLKNADDAVVPDGDYSLTFRLYDGQTGGTAIWTETQTVAVADGIFNAILGSVSALNLAFDVQYWLGVSVAAEPELVPRVRLTASPYAVRAATAEVGADSDWVIDGQNVFRMLGNVGIGTASPAAKLTVFGTVDVGENDLGHDVNLYGQDPGSRLFWDESTMALHSGVDTDGTHWDDLHTGLGSLAVGLDASASGNYSVAMGVRSEAGTFASVALGQDAVASDHQCIAIGTAVQATYDAAVAIGNDAIACGPDAIAIGKYVSAGIGSAPKSFVIGTGLSPSTRLASTSGEALLIGFRGIDDVFVDGYEHRVGIGTRYPAVKLDITDMVRVRGENYPSYPTTGTGLELAYRPSDNTGIIQAFDRGTGQFGDLYLGSGNVGIGSSTPSRPLYIALGLGNAIADGWDTHSSRECKTDITPLEARDYAQTLDTLEGVEVVQYRYKDDAPGGKLRVGIIAEDAPEVLLGADGKSMSLSDCVGFLLAATKALAAENEELRVRLESLEQTGDR